MKSETTEQRANGIGRRGFMRKVGVGVGTAAAVSGGALRLDHGPVQNSEAIAPAVVAAGVGGSMALGWTLREVEILGSDSPAEGLTADALHNQVYDTAQARQSNNASTFVDNRNIIDSSTNVAYGDGKIAAIEGLNDQKSESEVLDDAQQAVDDYYKTVYNNIIGSWNESVNEFYSMVQTLRDHPDIGVFTAFDIGQEFSPSILDKQTNTVSLPSDIEMDVHAIKAEDYQNGSVTRTWSPFTNDYEMDGDGSWNVDPWMTALHPSDGSNIEYLEHSPWNDLVTELQDAHEEVLTGISTYVSKVYSEVQSGEIDTSELLTPREQAELTSEDEDFPQAIADLQALNVSVDLEREAEIYLPEVEATLYGQLAYTGDRTLEVGTVDPDATDEDGDPLYPGTIYFNYDISQGEGVWSAYDTGVDGGTVTFTSQPFEQTVYSLTTTAGETVSFTTGDLEEDEDNEEWTVDLSDQLDNAITEVDSIEYYADTDGTQYETIQLQDTFEIIDFTDSDGNSYDETNFERSEPQTDDNYITEEEWQEQQERQEELIQKYEDAQGSAGILPDFDNIGDIPAEYIAAAAAVVGGAALFGNSG